MRGLGFGIRQSKSKVSFPYSENNLLSVWDGSLLQDGTGLKDMKLLSDAKYVESPCLLLIAPSTATLTLGGSYTINNVKYDSDLGTDLTGVTIATRTITLTSITANHKVWNIRIYNASNVLQAQFPIIKNYGLMLDIINGNTATINGTETTHWSWSTQDVYHWFEQNGGSKLYRYKSGNYLRSINPYQAGAHTNYDTKGVHTTGKMSINIVFRLDSLPTGNGVLYERRFLNGAGAAGRTSYFGTNSSGSPRPIMGLDGDLDNCYTTTNVLSLNTTYFITYVVDNNGSTSSYKMFLNGVEQNLGVTSTALCIEKDLEDILIGAHYDGTRYSSGIIYQVSDFNCAFTLAEHQEWYNSGNPIEATAHSQAANLFFYHKDKGIGLSKDLSLMGSNLKAVNTTDAYCFIPKKSGTTVDALGITCNRSNTNTFKGGCKLQPNPNNVASLTDSGIFSTTKWTEDDLISKVGRKLYADGIAGIGVSNIIAFSSNLTLSNHLKALTFYGFSLVDTYIIKGQSNAEGVSLPALLPVDYQGEIPNVLIYQQNGWRKLNQTYHFNQYPSYNTGNGWGFEMSMLKTLGALKNIRCIKYAISGTALAQVAGDDWNALDTNELLDKSQTAVISASLEALLDKIVLKLIKYVWYQGETDAGVLANANAYKANEDALWSDEKAFMANIPNIISDNIVMIDIQPKDGYATYNSTVRAAKTTRDTENIDVIAFDATPFDHYDQHLSATGYVDIGIALANLL